MQWIVLSLSKGKIGKTSHLCEANFILMEIKPALAQMIPENNEAREISFYQGKWMVGSVNKGCPISSSAPEAQNATILMVFQLDLQ